MVSDIDALRRQLQQLQSAHDDGSVDSASYQREREALEMRIVESVMQGDLPTPIPTPVSTPAAAETTAASAAPAPSSGAVRTPWRLLSVVAVGVLAIAAAGYSWTGSPRAAIEPPQAMQAAAPADAGQIAAMVDKLAKHLQEQPGDAEGWRMLGRSYQVLSRPTDAVAAFAKAVALNGNDAALLADYADALAMAQNRDLSGEPIKQVKKALQIDPDNLKALSLAGSEAFSRQDFKAAVTYWERVAALAPADSEFLGQLREGIAEARQRAGLPPAVAAASAAPAAPTASAAAAVAGRSIAGTVTLAASLRNKAAPEDTVFIFARAAQGPRMPLAIVRKQVKDLPFDFVLDDSSAMSPTLKLSGFERVVVGARISKSGDAIPHPGDLAGQSEPLAPGARGLKLEISQVVAP